MILWLLMPFLLVNLALMRLARLGLPLSPCRYHSNLLRLMILALRSPSVIQHLFLDVCVFRPDIWKVVEEINNGIVPIPGFLLHHDIHCRGNCRYNKLVGHMPEFKISEEYTYPSTTTNKVEVDNR
ncbi:hypothetical protein BGW36DRAFT_387139 [Talaromyces proteolyticus]|uniref:Uncharacterized protein n=1 Tax=Talaromyces proteolyticus TaxID=1131652 RepID=A0AAD4KI20_9EURO|nr:uncharacterized protein BGW36DRAFT_387139 [Talaromyces proteolyticus]KAH8692175.1 hypothetical protein BGW36DRAFT_387139 [Talaromyces proteolyticus]